MSNLQLRQILAQEGLIKTAAELSLEAHLDVWFYSIFKNLNRSIKFTEWAKVGPLKVDGHDKRHTTLHLRDVTDPAEPVMEYPHVAVTLSLMPSQRLAVLLDVEGGERPSKEDLFFGPSASPDDIATSILEKAGEVFERAF